MGSQFAIVSKYPLSSAETVQVLVFSATAWDDATLWNWVEPGIHQSKRMAWDMKSITYSVIVVTRQIRPKQLVSNSAMPSWWLHQMEVFSALLALCEGNLPVTVEFPSQGQWRGALMFSLGFAWINGWVNNRVAGDLRRHRAHYDVTVMFFVVNLLLIPHNSH